MSDSLDSQIIDALEADHPQSVRHVFYLMTNPRLPEPVEKSERGYRHVQDRIVKLRRWGIVPYGWITDATRRGYFVNTYRNAADFINAMKGFTVRISGKTRLTTAKFGVSLDRLPE